MTLYDIEGNVIPHGTAALCVPLVPGGLISGTGMPTQTYATFWNFRKTRLVSVENGVVSVTVNADDISKISTLKAYEYADKQGGGIEFIGVNESLAKTETGWSYVPSDGVNYARFIMILSSASTDSFHPVEILQGEEEIKLCKNPKLSDVNSIPLSYIVSGDIYTSGRLLLPANYSIDGKPAPLYVVLHGTTSMNQWTTDIGVNSGTSTRPLLDYMCNEGFAVFDCYPFTSALYKATDQYACAPLPIFVRAYVEGIKYICENYNIDINNVCISALSLGGQLAYPFMHETEIQPRAIAMFAPSSSFVNLFTGGVLFQANFARQLMVDYLGLSSKTNASKFVSVSKGLADSDVVLFMNDNIDEFAGMICSAVGSSGASFEDFYSWTTTLATELPQWMIDKNIPALPTPNGTPQLVNHPELSMYSPVPVKFWQAFDDVNLSGHANYTVYTWLKNGGTNVRWRTMPNGTGGHHAMDTDPNALKSSGTTRLGIAYSNIATAYVEMADFFYQNMEGVS